jgi:5'-methylthioadenosine phosphorylase
VAGTGADAEIGIFGGSGFYSFFDDATEQVVDTPYGRPSDVVTLGEVAGRTVAFLPRHGRNHQHPPHKVNYRANVWAMKSLGVTHLLGPCAAGSLAPEVAPGHFVVCDQLVDRTSGRQHTFYDGPVTTHVSFADPYDPDLRDVILTQAKELGIPVHDRGTMVVVEGPRFSTRAESVWFASMGWSVINMTGYPEAVLARELEISYANISLITDYDVGVEGQSDAGVVSHEEVVRVFKANQDNLRRLLLAVVPAIPERQSDLSANALKGARIEAHP